MDIQLQPSIEELPPPCNGSVAEVRPTVLFSVDDWVKYSFIPHPTYVHDLLQKATEPKPKPAPKQSAPLHPTMSVSTSSMAAAKRPASALTPQLHAGNPPPAAPQQRGKPRKMAPHIPHRVYSTLSRYEHRQYIILRLKSVKERLTAAEQDNLNQLQKRVEQEQKEYRTYKQMTAAHCNICLAVQAGEVDPVDHRCNNHHFVAPGVENVFRSLLLNMRFRKLLYPAHYCATGQPIDWEDIATGSITWKRVSTTTHAMGTIPAFKVHNCTQGSCIPWHYIDPNICPYHIVGCPMKQYTWTKSLKVPVISADRVALDLCAEHGATFAMSSSTFLALALLFTRPQRRTVIPLKVVEEKGKRRVLLDKPLMQEKYTYREVNTRFYKTAFIADCIDTAREGKVLGPPAEGVGTNSNLTYDTFEVGKHRILVRKRLHGIEPDSNVVYVRARTEYNNRGFDMEMDGNRRLEYELLPDLEFLQHYFSLLIRPSVRLILGRVNVYNSTVPRVDRFMLEGLEKYIKSRKEMPQPESCLLLVDRILTALQGLTQGRYLLHHEAGTKAISVMAECSEAQAAFDMHKFCDEAGQMDKETVTFMESSDEILTQDKVPNTFPLPSGIREFSWASKKNKALVDQDINYNISLFLFNRDPHHVKVLTRDELRNYALDRKIPNPEPAAKPPALSTHQRKKQCTGGAEPRKRGQARANSPRAIGDEQAEDGTERSRSPSPVLSDNELSLDSDDDENTDLSEVSIGKW